MRLYEQMIQHYQLMQGGGGAPKKQPSPPSDNDQVSPARGTTLPAVSSPVASASTTAVPMADKANLNKAVNLIKTAVNKVTIILPNTLLITSCHQLTPLLTLFCPPRARRPGRTTKRTNAMPFISPPSRTYSASSPHLPYVATLICRSRFLVDSMPPRTWWERPVARGGQCSCAKYSTRY